MPAGADPIDCDNLQALFDLCNGRYFNGTLRCSDAFTVSYSAAERQMSRFRYCTDTGQPLAIDLSYRLRDHPRALRSILVREMIPMLALQCYRDTGDVTFLDREPLYGHLFIEPGLGAFFLAQMEHLNLQFPELCLTVKPRFGSGSLFDQNRIPTARLVIIPTDPANNAGVIYRLHDKAPTHWRALREMAWLHHNAHDISILRVSGALAEAYPLLRKDHQPRANARAHPETDFDLVVQELRDHRLTAELKATGVPSEPDAVSGQFAGWHPEAYSGY
ncbi:hypothetical protein [Marinobacter zhanjiangensis]|uniref:Uncharacterized protein n=1 Tax=Marinobacter zhanjiangensis TaxID=578215 RepID=A0ABQ3B561_9GAMM|nr:hypothetical protein [Marinobacter zhanjiangensis]GGY75152.1 hypothetical protein GCM10007071_22960 [Marinobacter zhanjiangensis]